MNALWIALVAVGIVAALAIKLLFASSSPLDVGPVSHNSLTELKAGKKSDRFSS